MWFETHLYSTMSKLQLKESSGEPGAKLPLKYSWLSWQYTKSDLRGEDTHCSCCGRLPLPLNRSTFQVTDGTSFSCLNKCPGWKNIDVGIAHCMQHSLAGPTAADWVAKIVCERRTALTGKMWWHYHHPNLIMPCTCICSHNTGLEPARPQPIQAAEEPPSRDANL